MSQQESTDGGAAGPAPGLTSKPSKARLFRSVLEDKSTQINPNEDDWDAERGVTSSGYVLGSLEECHALRLVHHRIRQFAALIPLWMEAPQDFDFVAEWVGNFVPQRISDVFRSQAEEEDMLIAAMKLELEAVLADPCRSQEEKIEVMRHVSDRQKMVFLKRAERLQQSALLLHDHHVKTFANMNSLSIEDDAVENNIFVGLSTLSNSCVAMLGKLFVFLRSAVEKKRLPAGASCTAIFPGGERQRTVYGLSNGLHGDLDRVVFPKDFEELKLIMKGKELPDLYRLKYGEPWDFGTDELDYLREKFLKQYANEELRKIQDTMKRNREDSLRNLDKELQKMRSDALKKAAEEAAALPSSASLRRASSTSSMTSGQIERKSSVVGELPAVAVPTTSSSAAGGGAGSSGLPPRPSSSASSNAAAEVPLFVTTQTSSELFATALSEPVQNGDEHEPAVETTRAGGGDGEPMSTKIASVRSPVTFCMEGDKGGATSTTTVPAASSTSSNQEVKVAAAASALSHATSQLHLVAETLHEQQQAMQNSNKRRSGRKALLSATTSLLGTVNSDPGSLLSPADNELDLPDDQNNASTKLHQASSGKQYTATIRVHDGRTELVVTPLDANSPASLSEPVVGGGGAQPNAKRSSPMRVRHQPPREPLSSALTGPLAELAAKVQHERELDRDHISSSTPVAQSEVPESFADRVASNDAGGRALTSKRVLSSQMMSRPGAGAAPPRSGAVTTAAAVAAQMTTKPSSTSTHLPKVLDRSNRIPQRVVSPAVGSRPSSQASLLSRVTSAQQQLPPQARTPQDILSANPDLAMMFPTTTMRSLTPSSAHQDEDASSHVVATTIAEQMMVDAMIQSRLQRNQLQTHQPFSSLSNNNNNNNNAQSAHVGVQEPLPSAMTNYHGAAETVDPLEWTSPQHHVVVPTAHLIPIATSVRYTEATEVPCLTQPSRKYHSTTPTLTNHVTPAGPERAHSAMQLTTPSNLLVGDAMALPNSSQRNAFAAQPLVHTNLRGTSSQGQRSSALVHSAIPDGGFSSEVTGGGNMFASHVARLRAAALMAPPPASDAWDQPQASPGHALAPTGTEPTLGLKPFFPTLKAHHHTHNNIASDFASPPSPVVEDISMISARRDELSALLNDEVHTVVAVDKASLRIAVAKPKFSYLM